VHVLVPSGVLSVLPGPGATTGKELVSHPLVRKVDITVFGIILIILHDFLKAHSGRYGYRACSRKHRWWKFSGFHCRAWREGKSVRDSLPHCLSIDVSQAPIIVFDDADLSSAVNGAAFASFVASGQTCVSGTRLLVQSRVYDEFVSQFLEKVKGITRRMGDRESNPTTYHKIT
jgi:hypothetical protein